MSENLVSEKQSATGRYKYEILFSESGTGRNKSEA